MKFLKIHAMTLTEPLMGHSETVALTLFVIKRYNINTLRCIVAQDLIMLWI